MDQGYFTDTQFACTVPEMCLTDLTYLELRWITESADSNKKVKTFLWVET